MLPSPMPMTSVGSHSLEAARAAALASHSAAGLASSAGLREAARLLRSSEALARAAVAAIQDATLRRDDPPRAHDAGASRPRGDRGAGPSGLGASERARGSSPASRLRRRRRKKKVAEKVQNMEISPEGMPPASLAVAEPTVSTGTAVFVPAARPPRVLAARHSRERTPPCVSSAPSRTAASSTASLGPDLRRFPVGSAVVFTGLVSRADLDRWDGAFFR